MPPTTRPQRPGPDLGRVGDSLAEALAWCHSPAFIAAEIAVLERSQAQGDTTETTAVLLRDWKRVQRTQATLVQLDDETKEAA